MGSVLVVITDVLIQQPSQVPLVQDDHMIQEILTYTANPALRNSVLPRTSECNPNRMAAHCLHGRDNIDTKLRVAIEDQESFRLFAAFPGSVQLQRNPKRVGVTSHIVVKDATLVVADNEKAVQNAETQRGYSEEVHRRNSLAIVPQKGHHSTGSESLHHPSIRSKQRPRFSMRTSSRGAGAEVGNAQRFPRLQAVFCTGLLEARALNQFTGLACADHAIIASCPRCERSLDTACCCAASGRVARLIFALPPPCTALALW